MRIIISLITISLMFSCKKEKEIKPNSSKPIVSTTHFTNNGSVFFYFPSKDGNYKYGDINVYVNNNGIGKITMMPSGWIPSCNTQGWGLNSINTVGTYTWKVIVTNSEDNYIKSGTFTITENSCESINVSK